MTKQSTQSGQALIGTLVLMILVFGMAGGLAMAASSLLHEQVAHRTAIANDLRAENAVMAQVAQVAGRGAGDTSQTCRQQPPVTNTLPDGFASQAYCYRFDGADSADMGSIVLSWTAGCGSASIPLTRGEHLWIFFSAVDSSGMIAWVDRSAGCDSKGKGQNACSFRHASLGPALAAMDCDHLQDLGSPSVHVLNVLSSPSAVRIVKGGGGGGDGGVGTGGDGDGQGNGNSAGSGSIYEFAATTGLGRHMQFEEAAIFVSRDGKTTRLLAQGAL